MVDPRFVPLSTYESLEPGEMQRRATAFFEHMNRRRTVRDFSERPIPPGVVEDCLRAAGTAPSGAHMQPWHFVVITDPDVKRRIRAAAEAEEREFYETRAPQEWLDALAPLGTDPNKPFLETAPCLIAVFVRRHGERPDGTTFPHYYATESVGLATGFLIAAVHHAGLVSLTHTPSPMGFLNELLGRPKSERPFLLLVVGYPAEGAEVPDLERAPLEQIATFRSQPDGEG